MTDNEIIKALECCRDYDCKNCTVDDCKDPLHQALDLINRQQAEIEMLKEVKEQLESDVINANMNLEHMTAEVERLSKIRSRLFYTENGELLKIPNELIEKIKKTSAAEAIKEFAERFLKIVHDNHYLLVDRINSKDYGMFTIGIEQAVDETKKEMVGDNDA